MKRLLKKHFSILAIPIALLALGLAILSSPLTSAASPGDIVINEIMYNPGTGN